MEGERERERRRIRRRDVQEMTRSQTQNATIILTDETIIPWDCVEGDERAPLPFRRTHPFPVTTGPELGTGTMSRNFGSNFKEPVTRLELKSVSPGKQECVRRGGCVSIGQSSRNVEVSTSPDLAELQFEYSWNFLSYHKRYRCAKICRG